MNAHKDVAVVQQHACRALWNISCDDDNQVVVREKGGIDAIITAMKAHKTAVGVQMDGCGALANLAINDENNDVIRDKGGVDVVFTAMKVWMLSSRP